MIDKLGSHEDKEKYRRYLLRSYVEDSRKVDKSPPDLFIFLDWIMYEYLVTRFILLDTKYKKNVWLIEN